MGFVTGTSLLASPLLPLVSGRARRMRARNYLSPAKSFSHLPPAHIFSSDLEAGVLLEAVSKAGSGQHPSFKDTGENQPLLSLPAPALWAWSWAT